MVGENEMKEEKITLKNMQSGDQKSISPQRSLEEISKKTTVCTADNIPKRKLRKFRSFFWFNYRMIFTSTAFIPLRPRSSRKVTMWSS